MNAKELYLEALECSVDEMSVFLDFACAGDARLRVEVEQMLENPDADSNHESGGGSGKNAEVA
jgi:hypothetical protein